MILQAVVQRPEAADPDFMFWCPGCKCGHAVWVRNANKHTGATWGFNGSMDKPTFTPSIRIRHYLRGEILCHLYVTDGRLHFLSDCTHELAGLVVDMVDMDTLSG